MIFLLIKAPAHPFFSEEVLKYLIPTTVTIFVFTLGLLTNWLKANLERRRQYQHLRGLFISWIPNLLSPVNLYAANCDDFSTRLKSSERLSAESIAFVSLNVGKLAAMDINHLVKAFIYNSTGNADQNNKHLYDLVSNLDYLNRLGPEMEAKYNEHYINANLLLKDWNSAYITLIDFPDKIYKQPTKSEARLTLEDQLRISMTTWLEQIHIHPQNTVLTYNLLLRPHFQLLNVYIEQTHSEEPELIAYCTAIQNAMIVYRQWQKSNAGYAIIFTNYGFKLRDTYQKTQDAINYFEQKTLIKQIST